MESKTNNEYANMDELRAKFEERVQMLGDKIKMEGILEYWDDIEFDTNLRLQVERLEADVELLEERVDDLEKENDNLKDEISDLEDELDE